MEELQRLGKKHDAYEDYTGLGEPKKNWEDTFRLSTEAKNAIRRNQISEEKCEPGFTHETWGKVMRGKD